MNAQELLSEWTDGDTGMRPARIKAVRDDLMAYTDEYIPRSIPRIEATILESPQRRGVITRKLKESAERSVSNEAEPSDGETDDET